MGDGEPVVGSAWTHSFRFRVQGIGVVSKGNESQHVFFQWMMELLEFGTTQPYRLYKV